MYMCVKFIIILPTHAHYEFNMLFSDPNINSGIPGIGPTPAPAVVNISACCIREGVHHECMAACSFDIDLTRIMTLKNPLICTPALPKIVACGAGIS